jgi:hypothetical protein
MAKLRLQVQRGAAAAAAATAPAPAPHTAAAHAASPTSAAAAAPALASGARASAVGKTAFEYAGFRDALASIVRVEGWRGLFKGAGARVLFFMPSQAISIASFEHFKAFYHARIYA